MNDKMGLPKNEPDKQLPRGNGKCKDPRRECQSTESKEEDLGQEVMDLSKTPLASTKKMDHGCGEESDSGDA